MRRMLVFNAVGVMGFAVQLGTLALLLRAHAPYLAATAVAVEAAVVHNFLWHERWTWRDRPAAGWVRLDRLFRFHLLNGLVSIAGNVALVWALVSAARVHPLVANAIAVLILSVVNYVSGDRLVFKTDAGSGIRDRLRGAQGERNEGQRRVRAAAGWQCR